MAKKVSLVLSHWYQLFEGLQESPQRFYDILEQSIEQRELPNTKRTQIDYREGGEALTVRKLPGLVTYANITLKRGITDDADLWAWRQKAMDGKVERKNGSVILLDDTGEEKVRWNFREGWPTKWTGADFNATGNEVAIETLEIVHEGVTKA